MRNKQTDVKTLIQFLDTLEEFQKLKEEKWEKVDDLVQSKNRPATPTEDWIIPPDENETKRLLMDDPKYRELRSSIIQLRKEVEPIVKFLGENGHVLNWLEFNNPLIGNASLDDCIDFAKRVLEIAKRTNYTLQRLRNLF